MIALDDATFNAMISSCETCGQWEQALKLLAAMPGASVQPSVISFHALMSACNRWRQWQHTLSLFDELSKATFPNVLTYTLVTRACEGKWQAQSLLSLLDSVSCLAQSSLRRAQPISFIELVAGALRKAKAAVRKPESWTPRGGHESGQCSMCLEHV